MFQSARGGLRFAGTVNATVSTIASRDMGDSRCSREADRPALFHRIARRALMGPVASVAEPSSSFSRLSLPC
jgi:hypothetical protein